MDKEWLYVLIPALVLGIAAVKFGVLKELAATAMDMAEGYNEQYNIDGVEGKKKE